MQIIIHPVNLEVSADLKEYINQRFNKFFKHYDYITNIEVYVKDHDQSQKVENPHIIEAIIHLPGPEIYADSASDSHKNAVNETLDKLRRQLKKYKEKHHSHRT